MQSNTWLTRKNFGKLDCSQAYHCLELADEQPIQKCRLTSVPERLPTSVWHMVLTVHFQRSPALFEINLTLSWKQIGAPDTLKTLALQPNGDKWTDTEHQICLLVQRQSRTETACGQMLI